MVSSQPLVNVTAFAYSISAPVQAESLQTDITKPATIHNSQL